MIQDVFLNQLNLQISACDLINSLMFSYCFFSIIHIKYSRCSYTYGLYNCFTKKNQNRSNKCNFTCILQQQNGKQSIIEVLFWGSVLQLSLEDLQVLPCQPGNVVSHSVMLILSVRFNNCLRSASSMSFSGEKSPGWNRMMLMWFAQSQGKVWIHVNVCI